MATILEFPDRPATGARGRKMAGQGAASAEIVIFPGVRIERWEEDQVSPHQARQQRASASRDTLELRD